MPKKSPVQLHYWRQLTGEQPEEIATDKWLALADDYTVDIVLAVFNGFDTPSGHYWTES
jgi:hypothetical protein